MTRDVITTVTDKSWSSNRPLKLQGNEYNTRMKYRSMDVNKVQQKIILDLKAEKPTKTDISERSAANKRELIIFRDGCQRVICVVS